MAQSSRFSRDITELKISNATLFQNYNNNVAIIEKHDSQIILLSKVFATISESVTHNSEELRKLDVMYSQLSTKDTEILTKVGQLSGKLSSLLKKV